MSNGDNSDLHNTGFGPLAEFGDKPQSDAFTWAIICACLIPWILVLLWAFT